MSDASSGRSEALKAIGDRLVLKLGQAVRTAKPSHILVAIHEVIASHADYPWITRFVVGVHWHLTTHVQRLPLLQETTRLLVQTLGQALLPARDGRIALKSIRVEPDERHAWIQMEVPRPDAPALDIGYMLAETPDGWMIRDLVVDGVSFVRSNRSSYDAAIQAGGIDNLIRAMAKEIREADVRR